MCRTESHFVCPSQYWVDDKEEKDKLINRYKNALQQQNCKYFNQVSMHFFLDLRHGEAERSVVEVS